MTIINLRDFYYWYTQDEYIEVTDDVAEALELKERFIHLWNALNSLPETQGRRGNAFFFLRQFIVPRKMLFESKPSSQIFEPTRFGKYEPP